MTLYINGKLQKYLKVWPYPPIREQQKNVLLKTSMALGVLIVAYFYFTTVVTEVNYRLSRLGLFCSVFTISMYMSPLVDLVPNSPGIITSLIRFWLFWQYPTGKEKHSSYRPLHA
ncbi:SWET1 protein, partial [Polypterus senegalus]